MKLSGYYNDNYKLFYDDRFYLFRFPKKNALMMDPRPIQEQDALKMMQGSGLNVPNLIYMHPDKSFSVQQFVEGFLVEDRYPPGKVLPKEILDNIAVFYKNLANLEVRDIAKYNDPQWPKEGRLLQFYLMLQKYAFELFKRHSRTHGRYYEFLGIDHKSFQIFQDRAKELTQRPWHLIHGDLHRGNMIIGHDKSTWMIDWELAMYGDILFCLAAHIHRSRYFEEGRDYLIAEVKNVLPKEFLVNFDEDLNFYLIFEAFKSIITDTVRFPTLVSDPDLSAKKEAELCLYYTDNLAKIAPLIGTKTASPDEAMVWFKDWASEQGLDQQALSEDISS